MSVRLPQVLKVFFFKLRMATGGEIVVFLTNGFA